MTVRGIIFDEDVKQLVHLLLRKHAREHADFNRYDNIGSRLSFDIANRGLRVMGFTLEQAKPTEDKK